jgi:hypothetical protein
MAKKRTKENKLNAKHPFLINWNLNSGEAASRSSVKRQSLPASFRQEKKAIQAEKANLLDKDNSLASIKKAIIKSLILASLILGLELVIYLAWHV